MTKRLLSVLLAPCLLFTSLSMTAFAYQQKNITNDMIDPELRFVGNAIRTVFPSFSEKSFRFCNFFIDHLLVGHAFTNEINYEEVEIPREDGSMLRLCVYTPKEKKENVPGLLWVHGGGYAIGSPEQDIGFIKSFVLESGCVVVAPDYTNSTDAPYPAALNDCYAALLWLKENGTGYGMREDQIFVGGNSAGGGLTAAITLYARDLGEVAIAFQMPLYPMLDDRMITESSQNNDAPIWNSASNEIAWKLYLGDAYGTDNVSKYASPARETDYSNLPPTLTYIGNIEPFTDETIQYVENLQAAGIDVSFRIFEGCFHGFDLFSFATPAKEAREFLLNGFLYAVENYTKAQP